MAVNQQSAQERMCKFQHLEFSFYHLDCYKYQILLMKDNRKLSSKFNDKKGFAAMDPLLCWTETG